MEQVPSYCFKFGPEIAWTLFLGIIVTIATMFYGADTADMVTWGAEEWKAFGTGMFATVGRFVAAFAITSITGKDLQDGFTKA